MPVIPTLTSRLRLPPAMKNNIINYCALSVAFFASVVTAGELNPKQKLGSAQKGPCHCGHCAPHLHHVLIGPPPPLLPIVDTMAVARFQAPARTTFQFRQESGTETPDNRTNGEPESGTEKNPRQQSSQESGSETPTVNQRLTKLEGDVDQLYKSLKLLVEQLAKDPGAE